MVRHGSSSRGVGGFLRRTGSHDRAPPSLLPSLPRGLELSRRQLVRVDVCAVELLLVRRQLLGLVHEEVGGSALQELRLGGRLLGSG